MASHDLPLATRNTSAPTAVTVPLTAVRSDSKLLTFYSFALPTSDVRCLYPLLGALSLLLNNFIPIMDLLLHTIIAFTCFWIIYKIVCSIFADYQAFLDLGKGGTPSTWRGWLSIKCLSTFGRLSNVLEPPRICPLLNPQKGILNPEDVPLRKGSRPTVFGIAPQRQLNQKASLPTFSILEAILVKFASDFPRELRVKTSFLEKHNIALFARPTEESDKRPTTREFGYEICHPHRYCGSLHMVLHPEDVRTIIEKGWGERHPLARSSWYWLFWHRYIRGCRPPVPETFVLIYAPRTKQELQTIQKLVRAAAWWVTGKGFGQDIDIDIYESKDHESRQDEGVRS